MRNTRVRPYVELAVVTLAAVSAYLLAAWLDLVGRFAAWSGEHEQLDLDELVVASVVATVGLALFGWRRYREAQLEARRLEEAQAALLETTDRYRSLFAHNPHGVYSLDRDGCFVSVNEAAQRLAGRQESDLLGKSFVDLLAPDAVEATVGLFHSAVAGTPRQALTAILTPSGERLELSVKASPIVVRGEVVGVYGVAEDVSDRKRLEREVQRTQAAVAAALDGILICAEDGAVRYANEASVRLHGAASADQLVGRPLESLLDEPGQETFRSQVLPAVVGGGRWVGQLPGRRPDGTTFALEASFSSIADGGLVAIGRDVTDRVETEAALRRSEERQRLLARVTREVIWDADLLTGSTVWSGALQEVLGYSEDAVELDESWWRSRLHPDDVADVVTSAEQALASGADQWSHEYRMRDRQDRYVTVLSRFRIIRDEDGRATRFLGSMLDVTEQRRQDEEVRLAHRAAEEANEAKSLFLANMSHEIRTPLTSVIAGTEMVRETPLTGEQASLLDRVHRSGERLLRLVDDLLDVSRIEAGQLRIERVPFDPASVVRQTSGWAADACAGKQLDFGLRLPSTLPERVIGDPERLTQVLTNLLGNAVKFTQRGQVQLLVDLVSAEARSARLRFTVEDTGAGISPDHQSHIFRSFSQADPSITRSHGGSGLGLAISQHIVEALGGSIGVDSEPGRGSRFFFEVPFDLPDSVPSGPAAASTPEDRLR